MPEQSARDIARGNQRDAEIERHQGLAVVGVGRSGTSVATQIAVNLGLRAPAPDDLMAANEFNPTGYWESNALSRLCDDMLARSGSTWWTVPASSTDEHVSELVRDFRPAAERSFISSFGTGPNWVWKDPRLTFLLPVWDQIIDIAAILVPFRSPMEVAASISRRDGLTIEQSLAVWERHSRLLLGALAGRRVLFMSYDDLCTKPSAWESRLNEFCFNAGLRTSVRGSAAGLIARPVRTAAGTSSVGQPRLNREQVAVYEAMIACTGEHSSFSPPALQPEAAEIQMTIDSITRPGWSACGA